MRPRMLLILAMLTAPAAAETQVELQPTDEPAPEVWPYSPAELTLNNPSDEPVESVALRWRRGGPTLVWDVELAPGQRKTVGVFLPAAWPDQTYHVSLRDADRREAASLEATISWPTELVRSDAFIDPHVWGRWNPSPPAWSRSARRNAMIVVAMVCLAAGGTLLVGGARLRAASAAGAIVAGFVVMALLLPSATDAWAPPAELASAQPDEPRRELLAVEAKRTATAELFEGVLAPVYLSRRDMAEDTMVLHVSAGRADVPIRGGQLRLFRRIDRQ